MNSFLGTKYARLLTILGLFCGVCSPLAFAVEKEAQPCAPQKNTLGVTGCRIDRDGSHDSLFESLNTISKSTSSHSIANEEGTPPSVQVLPGCELLLDLKRECEELIKGSKEKGIEKSKISDFLKKVSPKNFDRMELAAIFRSLTRLSFDKFIYYINQFGQATSPTKLDFLWSKLTHDGYEATMDRVMTELVNTLNVVLCYRKSTFASEGLQEEGLETKPMSVHNKSSTLAGINGLVPIDPIGGKIGNKLRLIWKNCGKEVETWARKPLCTSSVRAEHDRLLKKVLKEKEMMEHHLGPSGGGYVSAPRIRERSGKKEVVVYTDSLDAPTQWVPFEGSDPKKFAMILARRKTDATGVRDLWVTADTDLVLVARAKSENLDPTVRVSPETGLETGKDMEARRLGNEIWKRITGNSNDILQHGSEIHYGLNPIDDVYRCHAPGDPEIRTFNLTDDKGEYGRRALQLKEYARYLDKKSTKYVINLPTQESQLAITKVFFHHDTLSEDARLAGIDYEYIRKSAASIAVGRTSSELNERISSVRFPAAPVDFSGLRAE